MLLCSFSLLDQQKRCSTNYFWVAWCICCLVSSLFHAKTLSNPEGLRLDGRRPMEMRQIRAQIGVVAKADGSASFEMGNTKVIAAVYGPREVQNRSQQISDQALVCCEYSMANFSTGDRMRKPKGDRRSMEISLVIFQTMGACILTHLMPRSQMDAKLPMDIFENVMQLAIEGCKAVANYIRKILLENTKQLKYRRGG